MKAKQNQNIQKAKENKEVLEEKENSIYNQLGIIKPQGKAKVALSSFGQDLDFSKFGQKLKGIHSELIRESKIFKQLRTNSFYCPNDYFVFEKSNLQELTLPHGSTPLWTEGEECEEEALLGKYLQSLQVYGFVKKVSPSEFYLCPLGRERPAIVKIDKNC